MLPQSQLMLAKVVVESWQRSRSNYILICPPMSGERNIIDKITSKNYMASILGDFHTQISIANLDTRHFSSEEKFALAVAEKWNVSNVASTEQDPSVILELACQAVEKKNKVPVVVIQRFHEALDKLGEDIGTTLRNLEHSHKLKTVVTMPVTLQTLRERWAAMQKHDAPFLASDWGQGHTNKLVKGYSLEELTALGKDYNLDARQCLQLHAATAGLAELTESLLEEIGNKQGNGLDRFFQSRSVDLCSRLVRWLDAKGVTHVYKKSIVNLMAMELYSGAIGQMRFHDWAGLILNSKSELNFYMLAYAAKNELARTENHSWLDDVIRLIKNRQFSEALSIVKIASETDQHNRPFWFCVQDSIQVCALFNDIYSSETDWGNALDALNDVSSHVAALPGIQNFLEESKRWVPLATLLSQFLGAKRNRQKERLELFICCDEGRTTKSIAPFIQLLDLRLRMADRFHSFHSLHAILTIPESLLQLFAFARFNVCFWDYKGLPENLSPKLSQAAGKPYTINNGVLGYSDLAHVIYLHSNELPNQSSMILTRDDLRTVLDFYEIRKELAHTTTFVDSKTYVDYREFCRNLIHRFNTSLDVNFTSLNIESLHEVPIRLLELIGSSRPA